MPTTLRRKAVTLAAATGLVLLGPAAFAHDDVVDDGVVDNAKATHGHHSQHGGEDGHLAPTREDVEIVGRGVVNRGTGRIADVGVHDGFAYLTAFRDPRCQQGGVHVMDIRDVTSPEQVTFIPTSPGSYAGEGSQVIRIDTPQFVGDVLAFNNEICAAKNSADGGMTLVDVTDPTEPKRLVEHAGDVQADGSVNEIHSVFIWDTGGKAYAVTVDNEEAADVDILDISDPRNPVMVAEYDLAADFPQILQEGVGLDSVFNHDMVVKKIGDRWVMLVSYWDGGYVTLDVTDPANASYIADSDFSFPDSGAAEHGLEVDPEGNAHQAEFTGDDEFILAADEDFGPYKPRSSNLSDGTEFTAIPGSGAPSFPAGESLDYTTKYVGLACAGSPVPAAGEGEIAVVERGVCAFTEKIANVAAAGYDAVVVYNREGADGCSDLVTMAADGATIPAVFVGRDVGHGFFDAPYDEDACRAGNGTVTSPIAVGTVGEDVRFESVFDGWGYVRLFANGAGKLEELDTYALPEAFDPDKATGSGDLSVHEVAVSEERDDLAYISYYAGGLRVVRITEDRQIEEVGRLIDEGGNNFWGVQVFEQDGREYVAASDRDSGLYILEYTGQE